VPDAHGNGRSFGITADKDGKRNLLRVAPPSRPLCFAALVILNALGPCLGCDCCYSGSFLVTRLIVGVLDRDEPQDDVTQLANLTQVVVHQL
jgi:hypothetical protein